MEATGNADVSWDPLEVVFAIDVRLDSYVWLRQFLGYFSIVLRRLNCEISRIKVTIILNGIRNSQDSDTKKRLVLINKAYQINNFLRDITPTGISDKDFEVKEGLTGPSWTENSRHVLVKIGDQCYDTFCKATFLEWMKEFGLLPKDSLIVYDLQCSEYPWVRVSNAFFSSETGDQQRLLAHKANLHLVVMALCYREANEMNLLAKYKSEITSQKQDASFYGETDIIFKNFRVDNLFNYVPPVAKNVPPSVTDFEELETSAEKSTLSDAKPLSNRRTKRITVKKTVYKKATLTSKSRSDKFKESNLPLLKRENVPESNFSLRLLPWSPWRLAVSSVEDISKENKELWKLSTEGIGHRLKVLPVPKSSSTRVRDKPALFEVAVQGSGTSKKRYVVFSAISSCSLGARDWERRLLGRVRSQIDLVLNSGGGVYVRFCLMTSKSQLFTSRRSLQRYDYAWSNVRKSRLGPRDVVKGNFVISKSGI